MPNCPEYLIAYFACWKIGAIAGPINSHLKNEELEYVLNNSEAVALITEQSFLSYIDALRPRLSFLQHVILIDAEAKDTIHYPSAVAACVMVKPKGSMHWRSTKPPGCGGFFIGMFSLLQ